jgi:hypothetical protein
VRRVRRRALLYSLNSSIDSSVVYDVDFSFWRRKRGGGLRGREVGGWSCLLGVANGEWSALASGVDWRVCFDEERQRRGRCMSARRCSSDLRTTMTDE